MKADGLETSFPVYNPRATTTSIDGPSKLHSGAGAEDITFRHSGLTVTANIIDPPHLALQVSAAPFIASSPTNGVLTVSAFDLNIAPASDQASTQTVRGQAESIGFKGQLGQFRLDDLSTFRFDHPGTAATDHERAVVAAGGGQ